MPVTDPPQTRPSPRVGEGGAPAPGEGPVSHLPPAMAAFILTARHTADAWEDCAATAADARDTRRAAIAQAMADLSRALAI